MIRWPVPPRSRFEDVALQPLTADLLELDTAAYVASPRAIRAHSAGRWPTEGFTAADNRPLIAHHEREHHEQTAFAYALLDPDGSRELGCAYLRPLADYLERTGTVLDPTPAGAAILSFWAVDDAAVRPSVTVLLGSLWSWVSQWGAATVVLRCLPEETEHVAAAEQLGLRELTAGEQPLPYRWFVRESPTER